VTPIWGRLRVVVEFALKVTNFAPAPARDFHMPLHRCAANHCSGVGRLTWAMVYRRSRVAPLFKFVPSKYRDLFFETGSLRLGTLGDFRDVLAHGPARADPRDAMKTVHREVGEMIEHRYEEPQPVIEDVIKLAPGAAVGITGMTFRVTYQAPDCFVFCSSLTCDEKLFLRWAREGADTCYIIEDPIAFGEALHQNCYSSVYHYFGRPVDYLAASVDWKMAQARSHAALCKDRAQYEWQSEFRYVFEPKKPPLTIEPWVILVPKARQFCKPFARCIGGQILLG
jgi:hypothetical protein